jgi:hypothetical protein
MSKKNFILENIKILESSIRIINYCTVALLLIFLFCLLVSLNLFKTSNKLIQSNAVEFLKYGFTVLTMLSSLSLQAFNYGRSRQKISLKYALDNIDSYESLTKTDQVLIDKIIEQLTLVKY